MVASWDLQMTNIVMMTDTDRPRLEHPPSTLKSRSGRSARNVAPCVPGSDIVDKFIAVSVGGGVGSLTLKDNRARENERENIRKKLAMEAEKMEKTDSSCDLQLCFRNEMASSDDDLSENVKEDEIDAAAAKAAEEEIVRCNISHKAGQIIVPIVTSPLTNHDAGLTCPPIGVLTPPIGVPTPGVETNPTRGDLRSSLAVSQFQAEVTNLQQRAREGLLRAREQAKVSIQDRINTRQKTNEKLFQLLGLPEFSKLNRRTLSRLNVAQLQLIQNDYLSQIQGLNEELVNLLVSKDGLVMEQDAMLTDIEDLSEFINLKK